MSSAALCWSNGVTTGEDIPEYAALSYPWGDTKDLREICLDGRPKVVTKNLADALKRLRKVPQEYFWADAICVNQYDLEERGEQMILMEMIYQNAVMVYTWIPGEQMDSSLRCCNSIADGLTAYGDDVAMWLVDLPGKCEAVNTIIWPALDAIALALKNEVWQRIWTFQEMVLAEELTFLSKGCSLERSKLENVCKALQRFRRREIAEPKWWRYLDTGAVRAYIEQLILEPLFFERSRAIIPRVDDNSRSKAARAKAKEEIFYVTRSMKATDPRDMCWGLLGVLSIDMVPSYKHSVEVVYRSFARWLVSQTSSLRLLCDGGVGQNKANDFSLRSWVPDWSKLFTTYSRTDYSADKGMLALGIGSYRFLNKVYLLTDGVILGTVAAVSNPLTTTNNAMGLRSGSLRAFAELWALILSQGQPYPSGEPALQVLFHTFMYDVDNHDVFGRKPGELGRYDLQVLACIFAFVHEMTLGYEQTASDYDFRTADDEDKVRVRQLLPLQKIFQQLDPGLLSTLLLEDSRSPFDELDWVESDDDQLGAVVRAMGEPAFTSDCIESPPMQRLKDLEVLMILQHFFGYDNPEAAVKADKKLCIALNEAYNLYLAQGAPVRQYLRADATLCRTETGYFGYTGTAVRAGDKLCIIGGCPYPVLMRIEESHYILIEPCFVHGLMYGQAAELVEGGKLGKQSFEIL